MREQKNREGRERRASSSNCRPLLCDWPDMPWSGGGGRPATVDEVGVVEMAGWPHDLLRIGVTGSILSQGQNLRLTADDRRQREEKRTIE